MEQVRRRVSTLANTLLVFSARQPSPNTRLNSFNQQRWWLALDVVRLVDTGGGDEQHARANAIDPQAANRERRVCRRGGW